MNILILNQAFHPDTVSTAQHAADLALGLTRAGHRVRVVASRRAYDDPATRFPAVENWQGIEITRIPCFGFGKGARWRRALDYLSFLVNLAARLSVLPRPDVIVAMTSPPLISFLAAVLSMVRGGSLVLWIMDLNPDEALAAGWLKPHSMVTRLLEAFLRVSLNRAQSVVVLDRFMKERIVARGIPGSRVSVVPPWSHDRVVAYDAAGRESFRKKHGLGEKFVVMYSGNHSPCHPLDTLLGAARALSRDQRVHFCFVGGGSEFRKVQALRQRESLANVTCLSYQPLHKLAASLSAADLQVVVMGDPFVGIVHPCKIYNILAAGLPVLYIGPEISHVTELLPEGSEGRWVFSFRHGEVERLAARLRECAAQRPERSPEVQAAAAAFSHSVLLERMISVVSGTPAASTVPARAAFHS